MGCPPCFAGMASRPREDLRPAPPNSLSGETPTLSQLEACLAPYEERGVRETVVVQESGV
jgi:hypothetical protein